MPKGSVYDPVEVYKIIKQVAVANGVTSIWPIVEGTSIVLRESGGDAKAYRDASKNKNGGNDRGWWQINSKAYPDVPDSVCYDPVQSTQWVFATSKGFTDWTSWKTSSGSGPRSGRNWAVALDAAVSAGDGDSLGSAGTPVSIGDAVDAVGAIPALATDSIGSTLGGAFLSWTDALGKFLSSLISPEWWKRIGIAAIGVFVIILGLILMFGKTAVQTVGSVK